MSYYFRPPNSREQNLYIVRFSVDDLGTSSFTSNVLNAAAYTSPQYVFLPANLSVTYNAPYFVLDYTNAKYEIPPTVNILMKDGTTGAAPQGFHASIISITNTSVLFYIYSGTPSVAVGPSSLSGCGIQVQVIGRTLTGPTFAIANQGWTYVESTSASTDVIYTNMKMGTSGITQPPYGLSVGGSFGFQGSGGTITNNTAIATYNPLTDLTSTNISSFSLFPIAISSTAAVALPSPQNVGQEIKIIVISNTNPGVNQITFTNVVQANTLPNVAISVTTTIPSTTINSTPYTIPLQTITSSTVPLTTPYLTNVGDTMTFISLSISNVLTWVKVTNK
jgi:hypothetical protein